MKQSAVYHVSCLYRSHSLGEPYPDFDDVSSFPIVLEATQNAAAREVEVPLSDPPEL